MPALWARERGAICPPCAAAAGLPLETALQLCSDAAMHVCVCIAVCAYMIQAHTCGMRVQYACTLDADVVSACVTPRVMHACMRACIQMQIVHATVQLVLE